MDKFFCLHDGKSTRVYCEYPNACPMCNNKIAPENIMEKHNPDLKHVSILFSCPACGKCFVAHYNYGDNTIQKDSYKYQQLLIVDSYPNKPDVIKFDKSIENLSASFCEIYNQANAAEIYGLHQISGIGYRKALEFLIKDYCIFRYQKEAETIKHMMLNQVINKYVDSEKIKNLSKASAWIGNDETHYIRKFEDKDISDLKRFISATVAFITYELISDEASEIVSSK